jgi:WhiB family redox-sensing transcriptional regulator
MYATSGALLPSGRVSDGAGSISITIALSSSSRITGGPSNRREHPRLTVAAVLEHADNTPWQEPKLSAIDANRITHTLAAEASIEWLMSGDGSDGLFMFSDLVHRPRWQIDAACRGVGTDVFMPGRGGSTAAAKVLCAACDVRAECLEYVLGIEDCDGHWGGLSAKQRVLLRTTRRRAS